MLCTVSLSDLVLIDDLQKVVVHIFLVNEGNILGRAVITNQDLYIIFLNFTSLFENSVILVGKILIKKSIPLVVGKGIAVQFFQTVTEIGNQVSLFMYL